MNTKPLAVLAIGGNALSPPDGVHDQGSEQAYAQTFAHVVTAFLKRGYRTLIVHGNGPQVGNLLLQNELASGFVHSSSLDICNAQTQGSIGYLLQRALVTEFHSHGIDRGVIGIITTVEVEIDPTKKPEKPIGRFYELAELQDIDPHQEKHYVELEPGKWRRTVLSPKPINVVEVAEIRMLLDHGSVVIAGGGGGIAFASIEGKFQPVEAVIDKDLTAALLAKQLDAEILFLMTNVDEVLLHYGTPEQEQIRNISYSDMKRYADQGYFQAGSMGPKVLAAIDYAETTGRVAIITRSELADQAIAGERGTIIHGNHI